jgi:hypothetical protein
MFLRKALMLVCGISMLAVAGVAQTPAATGAQAVSTVSTGGTKVHGTIMDPDGELIPGATITFTPAKGGAAKTKSGSDGTYSVSVAPGSYTLTVTMPGFAAYSVVNLKVPAVPSTTVDAKLNIGEQTQVVNVDANALTLSVDPDNNADSTILTGKDLEALSDDPDELSSELTALAGPSAGPNGGQIYVDGFTGGQLPPKSSIREIRINQNPFSAEYDKLGYGRIEVFTKPGTDKIHGNFQLNYDPSQFNSSDPLTTTFQPSYHTLFMFGNFTGPINKSASYNLGGSFRQIQDDEFTNATILAAPGTTTLCLPGTPIFATCVPTTEQASTYYPQIRADINPRLDLALGSKNVLTTRYQYVNNSSTDAGVGNLTLPTAGYNTSSVSNIVQMSDTQTWNSKLINETRFEYEREHVSTTPYNSTPTVNVSGNFTGGGYGNQNLSDHQDHFEVQNYTSIQLKKNFIRFGGRLRMTREAQNTGENTNGSFTYSGLTYSCNAAIQSCPTTTTGIGGAADNSYQTGTPSQFSDTVVNNHDIGDTYADVGLYAETDWKARQNLTISYGIRYEAQNHFSDHDDWAPRVSISYGVGNKKGSPQVVLHGGFGLFYDRFAQSTILNLEQENGTNELVYTLSSIPSGCYPSLSPSTLFGVCVPSGTAAKTQTTYQLAGNAHAPYITEFAGGADKQLGRIGTVSFNFVHSQGVHALATQNLNYNFSPTAPGAATATGPQYQYFTEGVFNQNQLIVNGRVQMAKWLSLFGYYSLNSAHGDTSGAGSFITTPGNIASDYGRTTFDVKNRVFLAGSITLPKFILISPFMIGQSGNPYNVTTGSDNNKDSVFNDRPDVVAASFANGTTVKTIGCGTFAQPGTVTGAAVAPINDCTGPALFTLNLRATKTFGFGGPSASVKAAAAAAAANQGGGGGGPGGGGPGGRGGPGGGGGRGGGGGGARGGGGGGMFGGGGGNTGKRYNLAIGVQLQNLFANEDLATPQGTLSSPHFGQSTQLVGGGGGGGGAYTTSSAVRRVAVQASFNF